MSRGSSRGCASSWADGTARHNCAGVGEARKVLAMTKRWYGYFALALEGQA